MITWKDCKSVPNEPGVYALFLRGELVYIGKAKNLRVRMRSHKRAMREATDEIRFLVIANDLRRTAVEVWLIRKHRPPLNIQVFPSMGRYTFDEIDKCETNWAARGVMIQ